MLLWSAGNAGASEGTRVEGATPPMEGAVSPLRPEAVQEAERELKLGVPAGGRTAFQVTLPPANRSERSAQAPGRGPVAVAFHRDMPEEYGGDLSSRFEWIPLAGGPIAAAMSVTSPDATDMRMGVQVDLPPGGELRFFGADAGRRFPVITRADLAWKGGKPQTLWSPVVEGDTIGVEITLPSRAALSTFTFRVDRISHGYEAEGASESGHVPEALECPHYHRDFQCGVGRHFPESRGTGTALLRFEESGEGYVCSGALLSDREDTFIPYLLTANHCISTARVASSVFARWFYRRSACGGSGLDSRDTTTSGGAALLATSAAQDATLLRLERRPPGGVWYNGWDPNRIRHPTPVYLIHHPDGGVKKYSAGRTTDHVDLTDGAEDAIMVDWSEGTTEGGSSGAGLFAGEYLVGVHSGSSVNPSSCSRRHAFAGAFSDFYPRIRRWLEASAPPPPRDDHGNNQAGATRVAIPSTTRGSLEQGGDVDWFRVTVSRAGELRVETTGGTDTHGTLFAEGGRRVAQDDDGGAGANFRVAADVQPGVHYVEVRGHDQRETGDYSLRVVLSASSSPPTRSGTVQVVPYIPRTGRATNQGFLGFENEGRTAVEVALDLYDDRGVHVAEALVEIPAGRTSWVSSHDLEQGNAERGVTSRPRGTAQGSILWATLTLPEKVRVLAYARAVGTGFVTAMSRTARHVRGDDGRWSAWLPFFNPASNQGVRSELRVLNPTGRERTLRLAAWDRDGAEGAAVVTCTVPAMSVIGLTAQDLETAPNEGDVGAGRCGTRGWGDGAGKWKVQVKDASPREEPLITMGLLHSAATGLVTNVSFPSLTGIGGESPVEPPPPAADLVVQSPSVSNGSPNAGQSFTFSATVRNTGGARSASTTLRYYRSSDATITSGDTQVGTDAVSGLAASGTSAESISLKAPSSAGTYQYGACVESVAGESNTRNNCSRAVRVTVATSPPPRWQRSGTGSDIFDLPVRIERIRIDGEFLGRGENFAVWCGGPGDRGALLVNEILGTAWERTRYSGVHSARRS